jgi:hypothetical protein
MPIVQGFARCDAGSMWFVIIHKSKDQFMERPPRAMMAELCEGVGETTMAETHEAQEGVSGGVRCSHWR